MFLSIDVHSDVAIYLQIVHQLKFAIAAGTLGPGKLLPSARVLAGQLTINPNTVARSYSSLQSDGVLETLRGRGMMITDSAVAICRRDREAILASRIADVLADSWHAGLPAEKIQSIVDKHLRKLGKATPSVLLPLPSDFASDVNSSPSSETKP